MRKICWMFDIQRKWLYYLTRMDLIVVVVGVFLFVCYLIESVFFDAWKKRQRFVHWRLSIKPSRGTKTIWTIGKTENSLHFLYLVFNALFHIFSTHRFVFQSDCLCKIEQISKESSFFNHCFDFFFLFFVDHGFAWFVDQHTYSFFRFRIEQYLLTFYCVSTIDIRSIFIKRDILSGIAVSLCVFVCVCKWFLTILNQSKYSKFL